jgi:hypothetical protein
MRAWMRAKRADQSSPGVLYASTQRCQGKAPEDEKNAYTKVFHDDYLWVGGALIIVKGGDGTIKRRAMKLGHPTKWPASISANVGRFKGRPSNRARKFKQL